MVGAGAMSEQPDEATWAVTEFGGAQLGDVRRTARVIELATTLARRPSASLPDACRDGAQLKAAYRFFSTAAAAPAPLLASHVAATQARLQAVPRVLAVQDTTELDYTHHPATTGLGALGDAQHQGLLVHSTLAFTPERLPLGVLAQEVWTRAVATLGQRATRKARPIAEKESQKWLTSLAAVRASAAQCPATHFVSVGDREADVYDLFVQDRPPQVDLLVRAAWDRRVAEEQEHLWAAVAAAPVLAAATVPVPRRGAQPTRPAEVTIRARTLTLRPPQHRAKERLPAVPIWAVWVREEHPPAGASPLEWLLLTTCPVVTAEDALEQVDWYACRWGIEVWHKVLKSGCAIEARQLATGDRLQRCLTLYSVIAWQVLYATMLARSLPDAPCTVLLEADEWQALYCAIHRVPIPAPTPPALRQAVRWIAQLGGFPARTRDGEPGVTVLWKGFQHLADLTTMYQIMKPLPARQHVDKG